MKVKVKVILIVIFALGTVTYELVQGLEDLEIRGRVEIGSELTGGNVDVHNPRNIFSKRIVLVYLSVNMYVYVCVHVCVCLCVCARVCVCVCVNIDSVRFI